MIEYILIFVCSFFTTLISTPFFIKKFKKIGLVSKDLNKLDKPVIPEMGGVSILFGLVIGILLIIVFSKEGLTQILAVLATVLMAGILGILDGLLGYFKPKENQTRWSRKWKGGISQLQHFLLPLLASFPLIAIQAGEYTMNIPFVGDVNFGLFYPFFIVPFIITVYCNACNMLAGLNGLEAGSGVVLALGVLITGISVGNPFLISVSLALIGALLAFLRFNFYPARIFPGDITPFVIGATVGSAVIVGNMEKIGIILLGWYYIEFLLKLRSGFKAQSFGIPQKSGGLKSPYEKIYSLTHVAMKLKDGKVKEWQATIFLLALQLIPLFFVIMMLVWRV